MGIIRTHLLNIVRSCPLASRDSSLEFVKPLRAIYSFSMNLLPSIMRGNSILLLLLLLSGVTIATAQNQAVVDSLQSLLPTAADTTKVHVLRNLGAQYQYNQSARAEQYFRQSLQLAQQLKWPYGTILAEQSLSWLYKNRGNYPQAQKLLFRALRFWQDRQDHRREWKTTNDIAELLSQTGEHEKSKQWHETALGLARANRDTVAITRTYTALGTTETRLNHWLVAATWFRQALALAERRQDAVGLAYTLNNLGDVYINLGQPQQALPYLFRALPYLEKIGNQQSKGLVLATVAQAYQQLGRLDIALSYAQEAYQLVAKTRSGPVRQAVAKVLSELHASRGEYQQAYRYASQSFALERNMLNQAKSRDLAELQTRYETQEKERNIQLLTQRNQLLTQGNQLQRLATQRQLILRNVALGISALLLVVGGVGYNRYQLRQRIMRQLAAQNQAIQVQKQAIEAQNQEKGLLLREIHHRVKNNLQIVLSLLNTQLKTLRDPAAADAIRESQSRVRAMALLHQIIYQSEHSARVEMHRYLTLLTQSIRRTFRQEAQNIELTLNAPGVELNTHTAVPLALIINELLTPAFKYAFGPDRDPTEPPTLLVELLRTNANAYQLVVADNGTGLPPLDLKTVPSLGLRLVHGFVQQLHGTVEVQRTPGTRFIISFEEALADQPAPEPEGRARRGAEFLKQEVSSTESDSHP